VAVEGGLKKRGRGGSGRRGEEVFLGSFAMVGWGRLRPGAKRPVVQRRI